MYHVDPVVTERNAFRVNASYLLIIVKWIAAIVVGLVILNKYFISASDDTGNCLAIAAY